MPNRNLRSNQNSESETLEQKPTLESINRMPISSGQLLHVQTFIEMASAASCPILIQGEPGTEKNAVACAIHNKSDRHKRALVEVNGSHQIDDDDFGKMLVHAFANGEGGTVFISGIDELTLVQQTLVVECIDLSRRVRVIAASTKYLSDEVAQGVFLKSLFSVLNVLSIVIPPLRTRPEDIPLLVNNALIKYRKNSRQIFNYKALEALHIYHWPKNHREIDRAISLLTDQVDEDIISFKHLRIFCPYLLTSIANKQGRSAGSTRGDFHYEKNIGSSISTLLLDRHFEFLSVLHPALQKALCYIADNYGEDVTLSSVASSACVSSSHLSYLFKNHLDKTFKQILSGVRIEKAKRLLIHDRYQRITDISFNAGFGDLSHFEKMFKRHAGVSPREFRRQSV
jgi:DNA-binding NtrC family response regulator